MRKATVRKNKAKIQSQRILKSKRKIKKQIGLSKGQQEKKAQSMGFTTQVNKKISEMMINDNQMQDIYAKNLPEIIITEEMDINTGEVTKIKPKENKLNYDQKEAIINLQKKHKDNFLKMQMDSKLNVFVWNQNKCKEIYEKYIRQFGDF